MRSPTVSIHELLNGSPAPMSMTDAERLAQTLNTIPAKLQDADGTSSLQPMALEQ
jgi:hypothetical protein